MKVTAPSSRFRAAMIITHRSLASFACRVVAAATAAFTGDAAVLDRRHARPRAPAHDDRAIRARRHRRGRDRAAARTSGTRSAKLVEAARIMDALFLRQVWAGNDAMLQELAARLASAPVGAARDRRPKRDCTTS